MIGGGGGGGGGGRTAVESCFKRAANLHSLHMDHDVIKHDITLSPYFTQEVEPADGTTRNKTTSERGRGERHSQKLREPPTPETIGFEIKSRESHLRGFSE